MSTTNSLPAHPAPNLRTSRPKLNSRFECSHGGPASYFLGFNIYRNRPAHKLYISQEHYIESLLSRFDMFECNPV